MGTLRYTVRITKSASGDWTAVVPDLPRCSAKGRTVETALRRVQASIRLELDKLRVKGLKPPRPRRTLAPAKRSEGPFDFYAVVVIES
jgi:predicted RNase H-like HicB family nuclease